MISNGKDQSIRLWDLRKMRSHTEHVKDPDARVKYGLRNWDYRSVRGELRLLELIERLTLHCGGQELHLWEAAVPGASGRLQCYDLSGAQGSEDVDQMPL